MRKLAFIAAVAVAASGASAAVVDGVLGSEWVGAVHTFVDVDPTVVTDFSVINTKNDNVAYDAYFRTDPTYVYVGIATAGSANGLDFANLYFDTNVAAANGSDVGFEINNSRAFKPGFAGYYPYTPSSGIEYAMTIAPTSSVIEVAIPWSFFQTDPLGIGFPTTSTVQLRTMQAFGYSPVGGAIASGQRFGTVSAVPEPTAAALLAPAGLLLARRRRA